MLHLVHPVNGFKPSLIRNRKMNEKQFAGKVAFVTGATSGIGHACAIAFAEAGAKVVCVGRKADALRDVEKRIQDIGSEALTIEADLSVVQEAEQAVQQAVAT